MLLAPMMTFHYYFCWLVTPMDTDKRALSLMAYTCCWSKEKIHCLLLVILLDISLTWLTANAGTRFIKAITML